jgi:hypothetical protein
VSFGQLVAAPSAQFALRNGHQNNLRLSRHGSAIKPAGDENHNTIGHLILSNQEPRSHFTTSLRNTSERRFTLRLVDIPTQALPTRPRPCTSLTIWQSLTSVTPLRCARGNPATDPLRRARGMVVEAEASIPSHGSRFTGRRSSQRRSAGPFSPTVHLTGTVEPFDSYWLTSCSPETQSRQGTVPLGTGTMIC